MLSLRGDHPKLVGLLSHGADPNVANRRTTTALHIASRLAYAQIAELLLSYGADVDCGGRQGETALHQAARANSLLVARLLLAAGADVNAGPDGRTPLMRALHAQSRMAELLRQYGATE